MGECVARRRREGPAEEGMGGSCFAEGEGSEEVRSEKNSAFALMGSVGFYFVGSRSFHSLV